MLVIVELKKYLYICRQWSTKHLNSAHYFKIFVLYNLKLI